MRNKLPINEVMKRVSKGKLGEVSMLATNHFIQLFLSGLRYFDEPSEEQVKKAIKKFQRDTGQEQTGELTFAQMRELERRYVRFTDTPIYSPGFGEKPYVHIGKEYASAEGTWAIEGDKIMSPINHGKIKCHKSSGICTCDPSRYVNSKAG